MLSALRALGALLLVLQTPQLPQPRGYINDFANVIPAANEEHMQRIVDDVRAKAADLAKRA